MNGIPQKRDAHKREKACGPITGFLQSPFSPVLFDFQTRLAVCSGIYTCSNISIH
jgi:hypothetical protein